MSELNESRPVNTVSSGNGWSVGKTASGFDVRITRADGSGDYGTEVAHPATEAMRNDAKERLLEIASDDIELERIDQAFDAPWVQA